MFLQLCKWSIRSACNSTTQRFEAFVASVSVGFGSKERPRNGIFSLHFSGCNSLLSNPTDTLATQAKFFDTTFIHVLLRYQAQTQIVTLYTRPGLFERWISYAIHNPVNNMVCCANTDPLDRDLSGG